MTRMNRGSLSALLGFVFVFASIGQLGAQETQAATSPASQPAAAASPTDASGAATEQGPSDRAIDDKTAASSSTPAQAAATTAPAVKGKKKGEEVYTGPTTVVELPPTPMLDEEGKQRQAPDGKLMFNPPVKQQRDKKRTSALLRRQASVADERQSGIRREREEAACQERKTA